MQKALKKMSRKVSQVSSDVVHVTTRSTNSIAGNISKTKDRVIPIHSTPGDAIRSVFGFFSRK